MFTFACGESSRTGALRNDPSLSQKNSRTMRWSVSLWALLCSLLSRGQFGFEQHQSIAVIRDAPLRLAWAGGLDAPQFSAIDLNADGAEDLFVFDRACDKVLTFVQEGAEGVAAYGYAPAYEALFPEMTDWALLVDYNCDGRKDIYTSTIGGCRVFKNVGTAADHAFALSTPRITTKLGEAAVFLYVGAADIPAIADLDGDGDLDMLSFGVSGQTVHYHSNRSVEDYGLCDSISYVTETLCWGKFREGSASNEVTLNDTLNYPCDKSTAERFELPLLPIEDRHSGSTLLALDMNADGAAELLVGDVSYTTLTLLTNEGTVPAARSKMIAQDRAFPSTTVPVDIAVHPAAFHVDINRDGVRDLLVAPSSKTGAENRVGVLHYANVGTEAAPVFEHRQRGFLQREMIEVGTAALPQFFDHNGDGLHDLIVSARGQFDSAATHLVSKMAYYKNTGTADRPEFTFVTDDYQQLSQRGIGNSLALYPTFGDLDGDGDSDMVLGEYAGGCYYLENTGGAGNEAVFAAHVPLGDKAGNPIAEEGSVYPQLVDLDRDGDLDLVNGKRNGKLAYYENVGDGARASFEKRTDELGGVDVSAHWSTEGHAVPQFVDTQKGVHLIAGSKSGYLYHYRHIDGRLDMDWQLSDSTMDGIHIGTYAAPAVADLDGDGRLEMVLGNWRGGVALYTSAPLDALGIAESREKRFRLYPNPSRGEVTVEWKDFAPAAHYASSLQLKDVSGRTVLEQAITSQKTTLSTAHLARGVYFLHLRGKRLNSSEKLVVD